MSNERVWTVDDDGDLLRGGYYPRGASGTGMADDEANELRAILERGQASAAPSEGDGRRPVVVRWDVLNGDTMGAIVVCDRCDGAKCEHCDGTGELHRPYELAKYLDSLTFTPPAPLPPGVHRAPSGELLCKGGALLSLPSGWQFRNMSGASWTLCSKFGSPSYNHSFFAVRPVPPVPEPERIKWFDAVEQKRSAPDGRVIAMGGVWNTGTFWVGDGEGKFIAQADADGLVSVLPLGDPK